MDDSIDEKIREVRLTVQSERDHLQPVTTELNPTPFEKNAVISADESPLSDSTQPPFVKLTDSRRRRLVLLNQGCYFGIALSIAAAIVPQQFFGNLMPMIWLALFVEITGISTYISPTTVIKTPAKSAALMMLFILLAPVVYLAVCSCFANHLPKEALEVAVAPACISASFTFCMLRPYLVNIERALENAGLAGFKYYLVYKGNFFGTLAFIMFFPVWLLGLHPISKHQNLDQLIPLFACLGFVAFAITTRTIMTAKVGQVEDTSKPKQIETR